ncbi:hypothetical protein Tco_0785307 [Tanacetum coccineum]
MDKGKGGSYGVDDRGFTEVKKKKSGGDNGGNKNFKPVSVKPKPQETHVNDDYDPYDDDMYEGQDIPDNIQSIYNNLDIKVEHIDRLVDNLCTVWIGHFCLHANIVRFQRPSAKSNTQPKVMNVGSQMGTYVWILKIRKIDSESAQNSKPALVLDDSCILKNDRKLSLTGKMLIELTSNDAKQNLHNHIGVGPWFTTLNHANPKFISDKRIVWVGIEGIPLHARTMNTYKKIGLKWGDVMSMEDPVDSGLYQKRLCVKMEEASIIFESFKVIVQGKVYWVRAKEVNGGILQRLEALVASPIVKEVINDLRRCPSRPLRWEGEG